MPTYDYRCRDCGHTIEIVHPFHEEGPTACERCQGAMVRVLHPAGVIFRGSGFYATDSRTSRDPGPKTGQGGGDAASAKTSKSDSSKPDSGGAGGAGGAD